MKEIADFFRTVMQLEIMLIWLLAALYNVLHPDKKAEVVEPKTRIVDWWN